MTYSTPIKISLAAPPTNRREILRYMGCPASACEVEGLVDRALALCEGKLRYDAVYATFDVTRGEDGELDLGFARVKSRDLAKCLADCEHIILIAATVGLEIDRLIAKYGKVEPSLALCIQALGAERIEALCDAAVTLLEGRFGALSPRFSAGYGDLDLGLQREIFAALDCPKSIGATLNESLLMSPTKSVTAIIGIKNKD
ncbi:MAG: Vitamin B12 dependent methionine synthase activation subunit [Clostridia bacterium]|nr:Vitamin B12 dependent methionine synthase activation subunit [Clostridia bacterium]